MSASPRQPPANVPVLTEILSEDLDVSDAAWTAADLMEGEGPAGSVGMPGSERRTSEDVMLQPLGDETALCDAVWTELDRQVSEVLEMRIRQRLSPVLSRLVDGLVAEVQDALGDELKALVAQAVQQALDRRSQGKA